MPILARNTLEALLEQLLEPAEPAATAAAPIDRAIAAARLAAAFDGDTGAASAAETGDPALALAAYLDGGVAMDGDGSAGRLADDPAALHELAAGLAFIDRVAATASTAPPDLVAAAVARLAPGAAVRAGNPRRVRWSPRAWRWSGAVAALVLLIAGGSTMLGERAPAPLQAGDGPGIRATDGVAAPRPQDELARRERAVDCPTADDSASGETAGKAADLPDARLREGGRGCRTTVDKARAEPQRAK